MKISEILHYAADHCLWNGNKQQWKLSDETLSCFAIDVACYQLKAGGYLRDLIRIGLETMGLDTESAMQFVEFRSGEERQGARYAWLKFAALIAEEQGV